jgi:hypothetical protein
MNYSKLNGIWTGSYKYGRCYPEEYKNREEPFTLEINFDDVNFKGTCHDPFTKSLFGEPALVYGTFVPNLISFIKKYPALLSADENGKVFAEPGKPSLEIHYTGFYYKGILSKTIRFEGEWNMTHFRVNESGKKDFYSLFGTWSMKK